MKDLSQGQFSTCKIYNSHETINVTAVYWLHNKNPIKCRLHFVVNQ